MAIAFEDVVIPNNRERGSMLDGQGRLLSSMRGCSSGELAFARLGKALVENVYLLDEELREELVRLLRLA